jgi:hypothetical protein
MKIIIGALAALALLSASDAAWTAQRTFVASSGDDGNPCSLAQPCRGFAAALVQTNAGGEIVVLDSAGYGRVTINKSVTIVAPAGIHAGISVFPGTNGIDIPTAGIKVVLRGLSITGQGGAHGIYVTGDNELTIERCDVGAMTGSGVFLDNVVGTVQIRDTKVHDNQSFGVALAGALSASLDRVDVERNALAGVFVIDGPRVEIHDARLMRNNRGLEVTTTGVRTTVVADNVRVGNSAQEGVRGLSTGAGIVFVGISRSEISFSTSYGMLIRATGSNVSEAAVSDSVFANNAVGVVFDSGTGGGTARGVLTRNVFYEGFANDPQHGAHIRSGGGNSVVPGTAITTPELTESF